MLYVVQRWAYIGVRRVYSNRVLFVGGSALYSGCSRVHYPSMPLRVPGYIPEYDSRVPGYIPEYSGCFLLLAGLQCTVVADMDERQLFVDHVAIMLNILFCVGWKAKAAIALMFRWFCQVFNF